MPHTSCNFQGFEPFFVSLCVGDFILQFTHTVVSDSIHLMQKQLLFCKINTKKEVTVFPTLSLVRVHLIVINAYIYICTCCVYVCVVIAIYHNGDSQSMNVEFKMVQCVFCFWHFFFSEKKDMVSQLHFLQFGGAIAQGLTRYIHKERK